MNVLIAPKSIRITIYSCINRSGILYCNLSYACVTLASLHYKTTLFGYELIKIQSNVVKIFVKLKHTERFSSCYLSMLYNLSH